MFIETNTGLLYEKTSEEIINGIKIVFLKKDSKTVIRSEDEFLRNFKELNKIVPKKASEFDPEEMVISVKDLSFLFVNNSEIKNLIKKIEEVL